MLDILNCRIKIRVTCACDLGETELPENAPLHRWPPSNPTHPQSLSAEYRPGATLSSMVANRRAFPRHPFYSSPLLLGLGDQGRSLSAQSQCPEWPGRASAGTGAAAPASCVQPLSAQTTAFPPPLLPCKEHSGSGERDLLCRTPNPHEDK